MTKKLILHIGMPKCGSTSIQKALILNSKALKEQNIFVPNELNFNSAWRLAAAANEDKDNKYFIEVLKTVRFQDLKHLKSEVIQDLAKIEKEMSKLDQCKLVISSEYLYSKCLTKESIINVKALLNSLYDEVEIIVFFKHPAKLLQSMYAQYVQGPAMGNLSFTQYAASNEGSEIYDFSRQLSLWRQVFETASFTIIDIHSLDKPGDLVKEVLALVSDEIMLTYEEDKQVTNKSFGYGNLQLLASFNSFKLKKRFLSKLSFNNLFIRLVRNTIRHLPLNKRFPTLEFSKLNYHYEELSTRKSATDNDLNRR